LIDKAKLGFWEIFTYFLIGLLVMIVILAYGYVTYELNWTKADKFLKNNSGLLLLLLPLTCLLIGMIFEPISNFIIKQVEKCPFVKPQPARNLIKLMPFVKKYTPANMEEALLYRHCKATVEQNCANTNIAIFLARFGFYRSLAVITNKVKFCEARATI
jgi:hypothetical protein